MQFNMPLHDIVRPILFFMEDTSVSDIWQKMLQEKEHISVITDEYGCMRSIPETFITRNPHQPKRRIERRR